MPRTLATLLVALALLAPGTTRAEDSLREEAASALTKAAAFYREKVARHGGYQYLYSADLKRSYGEIRRGAETAVSVQPPGTPAVGIVFLDAYEATGDRAHLDGALAAARCLIEGQLRSGGWGYGVEYDPELRGTHAYRIEPEAPGQDNLSVLDDDTTQAALRFMMRLDAILHFENETIHKAVELGLGSLVKAQYPNGAWPQRYESAPDPATHPVKKAGYPGEWSRTHPGPHYKGHYTFNDNAIADAIKTLFEAARVYGDERYRAAARRGGDFILLAQLPEPQPAWAQQYDVDMHPTWARRFEPPAVSGRESQDILLALLELFRETGDPKYLAPVPAAVAYFQRSGLPDGLLARFYELRTNEPLYFTRDYELTYSDDDVPTHYRFKVPNRLDGIDAEYRRLRALGSKVAGTSPRSDRSIEELRELVHEAIARLDGEGRWLEEGTIPRSPPGSNGPILRSATFVRYAGALAEFLEATESTAQPEAARPTGTEHRNGLGMRLLRVEPGRFQMGEGQMPLPEALTDGKRHRRDGDPDERPVHPVSVGQPFYIGAYEVTNTEYEAFDPAHRELRGRLGFSSGDDEAVVFVSWHDAVAFCRWLSKREGQPYRLPTEAEWEYAARAGTATHFHTGDALPEAFLDNPGRSWYPHPRVSDPEEPKRVSLRVGKSPPNAWGLHDVHGNVEEWVHDWYGPYSAGEQADPVGPVSGDFRVTRGGSHSTEAYFLRSANRSGTLPEDRSWLIGFRVVLGPLPDTSPLPWPAVEAHRRDVGPSRESGGQVDPDQPFFRGPRRYVNIPEDSWGPLFSKHNHDPALVDCPNGDLLAIWFSCVSEPGRELGLLASRLRHGAEEWEPASVFWDAPDRNDSAPALWNNGRGTLYHFVGLSAAATWGNLATVMRTSTDSGASWSPARLILPDHGMRHMPVESVFETRDGQILLPVDANLSSTIWLSPDGGQSWHSPAGTIAGIHAGIVQLTDGRLMALGRGQNVDGRMPMSLSSDGGKSWSVSASPFAPLSGGQRLAFLRLSEGALFFASFAPRLTVQDQSGRERVVSGLYAAVSEDEGKSWPWRRLVTDDGPTRLVETMDGHLVPFGAHSSEPVGYLSVAQEPDGLIHLITSQQHYAFNLAWVKTPPPTAAPPTPHEGRRLPRRPTLSVVEDESLGVREPSGWRFESEGAREDEVLTGTPGGWRVAAGAEQRFRLRDRRESGFGGVDASRGFTAEIRLRVEASPEGGRGVDLELYDAQGARYAVTVTATGVYWYEGAVRGTAYLPFDGFTPLAEGLDNAEEPHDYRIAVRSDRVAQIYRDGERIGVREFQYRTPREAYLAWGAAEGVTAEVTSIGFDLEGAFEP